MLGFILALHRAGPASATKDALEGLILTATRTIETLGARFSEIDEKAATWTISRERVKSAKQDVVLLPMRAREIFAACKHSGEGDFLFESARGKPLMAMLMQMRRTRATGVPHGFRYSFRDWAGDRGLPRGEVAKASPEQRKKLMDDWAGFCTGRGAPPVSIPKRRQRAGRRKLLRARSTLAWITQSST